MSESEQTILVVDDEDAVRRLLRRCFENAQYHVLEASNGQELRQHLDNSHVDLITLDLSLANEDGLDLARAIRTHSNVPIIMVSGKGELIDTVVGLEIGADDYISKPFELREVIARVRAVLRRHHQQPAVSNCADNSVSTELAKPLSPSNTQLTFGGWILDTGTRELRDESHTVCELTTGEYDLLLLFVRKSRRVLSRDFIMDELKGNDWLPNDRTIDNQVARLRKKIEGSNSETKLIKTIRGTGYMFTAEVHEN